MSLKSAKKRINERLKPRLWNWDFIGLHPILKDIKKFSKLIKKDNPKKMLDLGCGVKPYASLFKFTDKFIGFDIAEDEGVDFVGENWDLPFKDDEFDGLISTQVLEHTAKIPETVQEIKRVVKNDGLVFVSVPFVFPEHGIPYDFYRFTRYGLKEVFKDFEIIEIIPSCGYISTQFRLANNFLMYVPLSKYIFFPIFFLNNILALAADFTAKVFFTLFGKKGEWIYDNFYMGMPENYSIIVRNKK